MTELADLPVVIRTRVVALAAEVLAEVAQLPPSLRRVAAFAPARRARLGAQAISAALADDGVRERVGRQVAARRSDEVLALVGGSLSDPIEAAALDWLVRSSGWAQRLSATAVGVGSEPEVSAEGGPDAARLRDRVEHLEQTLREARAAHRQQVDEYKVEIATLRRKLGDLRQQDRRADLELGIATAAHEREVAITAQQQADAARLTAELRAASLTEEVARLQAQLSQRSGPGEQSVSKSVRDETSVRARLLLDTILEASAGLRRELALPPGEQTPGARLEESWQPTTASVGPEGSAHKAGPPLTAALLDRYLAMPRSRLIIDGYNVSKLAWPTSSLETQRLRLLNALTPLVARTGAEATVVFDAANSTSRPAGQAPRGVRVVFSPPGVIADDVVGELAEAEPAGRVVLVVSDDREVVARISRSGARPVPSRVLIDLVTRSG